MSLQTQYKKFADAIALTRESQNYKDAREKDDLITPKIETAFKEKGYKVDSNFLQGSLATHTGIIPLDGDYDIDRAIAITKESSPKNPIEPKKIVKDVLLNHGFKEPKIKKPCVTADYKTKPIHIDYPIYRIDVLGNYQLAVGKENSDENNRSWGDSAPKELVNWITSDKNHQSWVGEKLSTEERSQFYRLVRYIKRWRDEKYAQESERKKVYSIALTVMMKESFKPCLDSDTGKADDHVALKDTLDVLLNNKSYFQYAGDDIYNISVQLPVTPYKDIFSENSKKVGTLLKKRLEKLLDILKEVEAKKTLKEKTELLQKHFGNDFPVAEDSKNHKSEGRVTAATGGLVGVSGGA